MTVERVGGGAPREVPASEAHPWDPSHESDLDDLAYLNNLHEAPLLHLLSERFKKVPTRAL